MFLIMLTSSEVEEVLIGHCKKTLQYESCTVKILKYEHVFKVLMRHETLFYDH